MKIIDALLQLKQAFVEQEGELTQITLTKKAVEALGRECPSPFIGICPHCFNILNDRILGVNIKKAKE